MSSLCKERSTILCILGKKMTFLYDDAMLATNFDKALKVVRDRYDQVSIQQATLLCLYCIAG